MLILSAVAATAITATGVYYIDYSRAGEKLSKFAQQMGSKPNKTSQKGGWEWTPAAKLKERFSFQGEEPKSKEPEDLFSVLADAILGKNKQSKPEDAAKARTLFIDEFRYFPKTIQKCSPFFVGKDKAAQTKIHFAPLDMTKSLICIGPPGSGKTEFFYNLVFQNWYTRAIIRCAKGQDFTPVVVDNTQGFALGLYNKSAIVWDIMSETNFLNMIGPVTLDLMVGAVGESKDQFFASSAADRIKNIFEEAYLRGTTSKARWAAFEDLLKAYEIRATAPKTTENKDVWNNILLVKETLLFWSYRVQSAQKTFSISSFLRSNYRLILNGSETTMKSYYSAFISAVVDEMLRMPDTKNDFTLLLLDEFLTMPLSETTKLKMFTMLRSKGGCVVTGMQFIPADEMAKKQILDSTRYAAILFNLQDKESTDHFKSFYGAQKYKETEVSTSRNKHDYVTGVSTSSQERESYFLSEEELQKKPPYTHLTIIATGEAYLGYTPQVNAKKLYNPLEDSFDLTEFKKIQRGID